MIVWWVRGLFFKEKIKKKIKMTIVSLNQQTVFQIRVNPDDEKGKVLGCYHFIHHPQPRSKTQSPRIPTTVLDYNDRKKEKRERLREWENSSTETVWVRASSDFGGFRVIPICSNPIDSRKNVCFLRFLISNLKTPLIFQPHISLWLLNLQVCFFAFFIFLVFFLCLVSYLTLLGYVWFSVW